MYKRPLVIGIYEPRWFMRIKDILNARKIDYSVYEDKDTIPYYSVFYTDYYDFVKETISRNDVLIVYDPEDTRIGLEISILATRFKEKYNTLTIGIDPGSKPYYLVIGDGEVIEHGYVSLEKICEKINYLLHNIPSREKIIRVGSGLNGFDIIYILKKTINNVKIEVVDEHETTPRSRVVNDINYLDKRLVKILKPYRNKDAYAALRIALRKGIEVE
ncbi:MAG: hypothetical protein J7L82_02150 [Staphylothermus sp.]|nr:hypothetical protein [Staphylothermus sp.]